MNDLALTDADNGKSFFVTSGARIVLHLNENPTTGYRWHLRGDITPVLGLESDDYTPSKGAGIGAGGFRTFSFLAREPGTQTLQLENMRPWEDSAKAIAIYTAVITVN